MTAARVLVVGGTGPSGPHVVAGLLERGLDVTVFHRGAHEPAGLAQAEHLHGDPHFRESIDDTLEARAFDLVVAMYGRARHLAAALAGRCGRFISVSGVPVYRGYFPVTGCLPLPVAEDHPVVSEDDGDPAARFSRKLADAERAVAGHHPGATIVRFPMLYGPNNARQAEWSVVRRIRDGRRHMIMPDGGGQVHTRCAARNAASLVLAAVDQPEAAAGHVFNCGDPGNWSLRQWAQAIAGLLGADLELVAIPRDIAVEATADLLPLAGTTAEHCVLSTERARHQLGWEPAIDPVEALRELLAWYDGDPPPDPAASPAFTDRFDYAGEDTLIAEYRRAGRRVAAAVRQRPAPPVHSMPHPQAPGTADHRGR